MLISNPTVLVKSNYRFMGQAKGNQKRHTNREKFCMGPWSSWSLWSPPLGGCCEVQTGHIHLQLTIVCHRKPTHPTWCMHTAITQRTFTNVSGDSTARQGCLPCLWNDTGPQPFVISAFLNLQGPPGVFFFFSPQNLIRIKGVNTLSLA